MDVATDATAVIAEDDIATFTAPVKASVNSHQHHYEQFWVER
jgi:hypothetical protein